MDEIASILAEHLDELKAEIDENVRYRCYKPLIKKAATVIAEHKDRPVPDPERISVVDYGDYQGTMVVVIAEKGYQPSVHWVLRLQYGSCAVCDALTDSDIDTAAKIALNAFQNATELSY